jgi:hypothetical protein
MHQLWHHESGQKKWIWDLPNAELLECESLFQNRLKFTTLFHMLYENMYYDMNNLSVAL